TRTNTTASLLETNTATLIMLRDETIFSFPAQFVVTEGTPYLQIPVSRTTNGTGPVSVQVITIDGTAIAGQDYVSVSTNLNWAAGDTSSQLRSEERRVGKGCGCRRRA